MVEKKITPLFNNGKLIEDSQFKCIISENFNSVFNKITGYTATWGKTKSEDPEYSPYGPLIADIEVSTICSNASHPVNKCLGCFKSNTKEGINMSLGTSKMVLGKLGPQVQQVALGIGDVSANPDLFDILNHMREIGIIPNITVNGIVSDEEIARFSSVLGAVAVSRYHSDICYNTVKRFTDQIGKNNTLKQVNIHQILSSETLSDCWQVLEDIQTDNRLENLNAVVFLLLKPKGRGSRMTLPLFSEYKNLIDYAMEKQIRFGMDSCGANFFIRAIKNHPNREQITQMVEPCESTRISVYVSASGLVYPCSFCEDIEKPIVLYRVNKFLEEVWMSQQFVSFRERNKCGNCPVYNLNMK